MIKDNKINSTAFAFLLDLSSNKKIPVTVPKCRVGNDALNDIVIKGDQAISRFHFVISYADEKFSLQDSTSAGGTFLNGNRITQTENIKDGDVLKIGFSLFWFVIENGND